jgi:hypothetical protein
MLGPAKVPKNSPELASLVFSAKAGWCGGLLLPRAEARGKVNIRTSGQINCKDCSALIY